MTDPWARPPGQVPPDQPTTQFPQQGRRTQHIPTQGRPVDGATQQIPQAPPQSYPGGPPSDQPPAKGSKLRRFFRDPLSIVLIVVIVVALVIAGLLGGELYARHRANTVIASVVSCVVQDKASASFGVVPPFLWQHSTGHYTNISIETAGNQIREAKGMKVNLQIDDVRLQDTANSGGTVGSLAATISWTSAGIQQTVQSAIPLLGSVISGVTTNPNDGTIQLEGPLGSVTAKPQVVDNGLSLQVVSVSGLGFTLPREIVQPALDAFTSQLTKSYPMGIHADDVQVTKDGVVSHFSTQNASIPKGGQDPCFTNL